MDEFRVKYLLQQDTTMIVYLSVVLSPYSIDRIMYLTLQTEYNNHSVSDTKDRIQS